YEGPTTSFPEGNTATPIPSTVLSSGSLNFTGSARTVLRLGSNHLLNITDGDIYARRGNDNAKIEFLNYGSNQDWLTVTIADDVDDVFRIRGRYYDDASGVYRNIADFPVVNDILFYRDLDMDGNGLVNVSSINGIDADDLGGAAESCDKDSVCEVNQLSLPGGYNLYRIYEDFNNKLIWRITESNNHPDYIWQTTKSDTNETINQLYLNGDTQTAIFAGSITARGDVGIGNTSNPEDSRYGPSTGTSVEIGEYNNSEIAQLLVQGRSSGQGTGYIYVGQSPQYGGGIAYNGDDNPSMPHSTDDLSIFRRTTSNGATSDTEVLSWSHNSNVANFTGSIKAPVIYDTNNDYYLNLDSSGTSINIYGDIVFDDPNNNVVNEIKNVDRINGIDVNMMTGEISDSGSFANGYLYCSGGIKYSGSWGACRWDEPGGFTGSCSRITFQENDGNFICDQPRIDIMEEGNIFTKSAHLGNTISDARVACSVLGGEIEDEWNTDADYYVPAKSNFDFPQGIAGRIGGDRKSSAVFWSTNNQSVYSSYTTAVICK
ncbi:MAG: hypothetical protein WD607_10320, partial [Candidatus Paceibacterota bacterium]